MTVVTPISIRRTMDDADADAIVALHERVYGPEYDRNDEFIAAVARTVVDARAAGWPDRGGAVWLLDSAGEVAGSLGLTDEGGGIGQVRWFVFAPEVRGHGHGRVLLAELLDVARVAGMRRLELDTFSELTTAARMYRGVGFKVVRAEPRDDWGPTITYQHYELDLR
jgi:GNAT superfamily N-acetyltransferase